MNSLLYIKNIKIHSLLPWTLNLNSSKNLVPRHSLDTGMASEMFVILSHLVNYVYNSIDVRDLEIVYRESIF